jgi:hypothetical protein
MAPIGMAVAHNPNIGLVAVQIVSLTWSSVINLYADLAPKLAIKPIAII